MLHISCTWPHDGVKILTEHRGQSEARTLPDANERMVPLSLTAAASPGMVAAVEAGKPVDVASRFHALAETRNAADVREIASALIVAGALVSSPEYKQTSAEVRDRRSRRRRVWL